jgi:hypothetical protein
MAVHKVLRKEIEREDGLNAEISGAIHSDGILDEVKGDFRVKCKEGDNSGGSSSTPKKYKENGFVAFTADYHGPERHTPKHN